jgi:hypothetical protein
MFALSPWTLARRAADGRRITLLLVIAALLYGFGLHAARACVPAPAMQGSLQWHIDRSSAGCHGDSGAHVADAACEAHCRADLQSSRAAFSFDLPAAAPADFAAPVTPLPLPESMALALAPAPRDTGPPLHILLQRLLR